MGLFNSLDDPIADELNQKETVPSSNPISPETWCVSVSVFSAPSTVVGRQLSPGIPIVRSLSGRPESYFDWVEIVSGGISNRYAGVFRIVLFDRLQ